jgi:hypothetical protein
MLGAFGDIDLSDPIEWDHPLSRAFVGLWLPTANRAGSQTVYDLMRANDGAFAAASGALPSWQNGSHDIPAVKFSGTNYVNLPRIHSGDTVTLWAWCYVSAGMGNAAPLLQVDYGGLAYRGLQISNTIPVQYGIISPGNQSRTFSGTTTASVGWHLICVTSNGLADHKLYLDGRWEASSTTSYNNSMANYLDGTGIGGKPGTYGFYGAYSERVGAAGLANYALSGDAIRELYLQCSLGFPNLLRRQSTARWLVGSGGGGGVTGAASITLDAVTASGSAQVAVSGSVAVTLGTLTATATGTVAVGSTAAVTLDDLTASGVASVTVDATSAVTLDDLTETATGTVAASGAIAATLGELSASGTGTAPVAAIAVVVFDDLTAIATGTVGATALASITLNDLTASGVSVTPVTGATAGQLDDLTTTGTATVLAAGTLSVTLDAVTLVSTGSGGGVQASATITLGDATATASGAVAVSGIAAATLDSLTLTATGSGGGVQASATITLGDMTCSATAQVAVNGTFAATLDDLTTTATGAVATSGGVALTLDDLTATGAATASASASATIALDDMTCSATGGLPVVGDTTLYMFLAI